MVLGVILLIVGIIGLVVGVVFFLKMKRMAAAPFKKTGEIATNPGVADAKGMISTEGQIVAQNAIRAPCSGQPCLYYEVTIEREWEKMVTTQQGTNKQTGTTKVTTNKGGAIFQLNDGSGGVNVDAREGVDADLQKAHEQKVPIGMMVPGEIVFGQMRMQTPVNLGPERTTGFKAVEKILPAQGSLYACGKLVNGSISKPGWTSLILSHKGREALLGSTKTKAYAGLIVGALLTVGSIPAFLFGPKVEDTSCPTAIKDIQQKCDDRINAAEGKDYTWTVTKPGQYSIRVVQPPVANPIDSTITIKNAQGAQVAYNDGGKPGADALVQQAFDVGTYKINVRDYARSTVEGGYSYQLFVSWDGPGTPAASAEATVSSATVTPPPPTGKPATPHTTTPAGKPPSAATAKPAGHK
jgi:hypothetical protein